MEDRADLLARDAALEILHRPHDREVALCDREELFGDAARVAHGECALERHLPTVVGRHDQRPRVRGLLVGRGDIDREEPCGDTPVAHSRQVEVTHLAALLQRPVAAPGAEQRVVVAVDDRDHARLRSTAEAAASAAAKAPSAMSAPAMTSVTRCEPPTTTAAATTTATMSARKPSLRSIANA